MATTEPRHETWRELCAATVGANPVRPLHVTVYPPYKREKYMAMHIHGMGWTDTRRYRWGGDKLCRLRSEAYGRRMVWEYIAVVFDMPVLAVRARGPEIAFEWSPLSWEQFEAMEDSE